MKFQLNSRGAIDLRQREICPTQQFNRRIKNRSKEQLHHPETHCLGSTVEVGPDSTGR